MIQTLLVPVDFTGASKKAVEYAITVAKKCNSKIIFVHGYTVNYAPNAASSMSSMSSPPPETIVSEQELSEEKLSEFLDGFPELHQVDFTDKIGAGSGVDVICKTAEDHNVSLIVMGTKGAEGAAAFFVGTHSEKVSRKATCPVLVVPDDLESYTIDTAGLAVDSEPMENTSSIDLLVQLLTVFNAKLRIIHISDQKKSDKKRTDFEKKKILAPYQNELDKIAYSFHVFYDEDSSTGILNFLSNNSLDMLSLFHRDHGFFERVFQPGLRRKMVFKSDIPILILN